MNKDVVVCIGTKGRPHTKTYKLFDGLFKVYHFIEPQDFDKYDVPNKINIEKNDKGIAYMRNFVLKWCKKNKHDWMILADDDIDRFGVSKGTKTIDKGAIIWEEIYNKVKTLPYEQYGINYSQFAWSETKQISINCKFVDCCVLFRLDKLSWDFGDWKLKVDRNFTLETIKNGYGALRFNKYWFSCPKVGTNKGGLQELYENKVDTIWAKKLVEKWKPFGKLFKKDGRIDAKIDIKAVAKHYDKVVYESH